MLVTNSLLSTREVAALFGWPVPRTIQLLKSANRELKGVLLVPGSGGRRGKRYWVSRRVFERAFPGVGERNTGGRRDAPLSIAEIAILRRHGAELSELREELEEMRKRVEVLASFVTRGGRAA